MTVDEKDALNLERIEKRQSRRTTVAVTVVGLFLVGCSFYAYWLITGQHAVSDAIRDSYINIESGQLIATSSTLLALVAALNIALAVRPREVSGSEASVSEWAAGLRENRWRSTLYQAAMFASAVAAFVGGVSIVRILTLSGTDDPIGDSIGKDYFPTFVCVLLAILTVMLVRPISAQGSVEVEVLRNRALAEESSQLIAKREQRLDVDRVASEQSHGRLWLIAAIAFRALIIAVCLTALIGISLVAAAAFSDGVNWGAFIDFNWLFFVGFIALATSGAYYDSVRASANWSAERSWFSIWLRFVIRTLIVIFAIVISVFSGADPSASVLKVFATAVLIAVVLIGGPVLVWIAEWRVKSTAGSRSESAERGLSLSLYFYAPAMRLVQMELDDAKVVAEAGSKKSDD